MPTTVLEKFYNVAGAAGGSTLKRITAAGTYNLTLYERHVDVSMASLAADVIVNLPDAAAAGAGVLFSVYLSAFAGSNDLVVNGPGVGTDYASGDMDAADECVVLMSDGLRWLPIYDTIP